MEAMLTKLLDQAFLFEDPAAYVAGVEDTYAALRDAMAQGITEPLAA